MTVSVDFQNITNARAESFPAGQYHAAFDTVQVFTAKARVALFLPAGTGQNVADAINAALQPVQAEAAQ